jgi:hypothetical protein
MLDISIILGWPVMIEIVRFLRSARLLCRAHGQCDREAGAAEIAGRTAVYCQSIASIVIASC